MRNRTHFSLLTLVALLATSAVAGAQANRRGIDTVDVSVGSSTIDFSSHIPGSTRAFQEMTMGDQKRASPPIVWRFTAVDTGSSHLLIVRGAPEQPPPNMPPQPEFVFDRRTMALKQTRDPETLAPQLSVDGVHVSGRALGPNGPAPIDLTLARPAFFLPLADLVTESLPRKLSVVYRVPFWDTRAPDVQTHLLQFVRREDVVVLGKTYPQAWVLEDRSADASRLFGTMWLIDRSPFLVRWVINQPNGAVIRLDQEPVDSPR